MPTTKKLDGKSSYDPYYLRQTRDTIPKLEGKVTIKKEMGNRFTWMLTHPTVMRNNGIPFSEIVNCKNLIPSYRAANEKNSRRNIEQSDWF